MSAHARLQRKKSRDAEHEHVPVFAAEPIATQHALPTLQPKLTISQPGDMYEQEAERIADAVVSDQGIDTQTLSAPPIVQRDSAAEMPRQSSGQLPPDAELPPPDAGPSAGEEFMDGLKTIGEALPETPEGKQLEARRDELWDELWGRPEGKVVVISSLVGLIGTLFAVDSELPAQLPEFKLNWPIPGLKVKLTVEGPLRNPSNAFLQLTLPLGGSSSGASETTSNRESAEKLAEVRRFRENLRYVPGSPEAEEVRAFQEAYDQWAAAQIKSPVDLSKPFQLEQSSLGASAGEDWPEVWDRFFRLRLRSPMIGDELRLPALSQPDVASQAPSLMRQAIGIADQPAPPPIVHEVLQSGGQLLDPATRAFMEPRFGHNFSQVRVHTDGQAAQSAAAVNALAYTVGQDVVFGAGQYQPGTDAGRRLMAHELTHVVQQSQSKSSLSLVEASTGLIQLQRYVSPLDILDYVGLGIDVAERIYLGYFYKGNDREFQLFLNFLFMTVDAALALLPGAGGGGLTMRASRGAMALTWEVIPSSTKAHIIGEVAKEMGWSIVRTAQLINSLMRNADEGSGGESSSGDEGGSTSSSGRSGTSHLEQRARWREEARKWFSENNIRSTGRQDTNTGKLIFQNSSRGRARQYYTIDEWHGQIEIFDNRGKHIGVIDIDRGIEFPAVESRYLGL